MFDSIKLSGKDVPKHLRGDYTGRKFRVQIVNSVTIPADAGVWGGGSREIYKAIRLDDGVSVALGSTEAPWSLQRKDNTIMLQPGYAVVLHSHFCGTDMGLTFFVHPANAGKFLK
jgi:hypothetical protein